MESIEWLIDLSWAAEPENLLRTVVSAAVIFLTAWLVFRIPGKRFLGKHAAFDALIGVIFGATLSRSVNGEAPLLETLLAILVMVLLHWLFSFLSYYFRPFRRMLEGHPLPLVKNGQMLKKHLKRNYINEFDLQTEMRCKTASTGIDQVKEAFLETNGEISFVVKGKEPRVYTVSVEEGVQHVRIEFG
jgi:uncharacterized membrane protein YcaP (DUF421 family)